MKLVKENFGFTIIETIVVLALLGVFGIGTGSYISSSFRDSNKLADKTVVQASVTSLMNELATDIKEASTPVLSIVKDTDTEKIYQISKKEKEGDPLIKINYEFDKNEQVVNKIKDNKILKSYQNIQDITMVSTSYNNGAEITIKGTDDQYNLTSKYYTRNIDAACSHNWGHNRTIQYQTCTISGIDEYMCSYCGTTVEKEVPATGHKNPSSWGYNDTNHWKACENCGEKTTPDQNHKIVDNKCTICGYVKDNSTKDNSTKDNNDDTKDNSTKDNNDDTKDNSTKDNNDDTKDNSTKDNNDDTKDNSTKDNNDDTKDNNDDTNCKHALEWAKSETNHYWACKACGYIESQGAHNFEIAKSPIKHYEACKTCGYIKSEGEHEFAWAKSETNHYKACKLCGYIKSQGAHNFEIADSNGLTTNQYKACKTCGYIESKIDKCEHEFAWAKSETNHYKACKLCGYIKSQGTHNFEVATSDTKHYEACKTCGYRKCEGDHELEWAKSETNHYKACKLCGYIESQGAHNFEIIKSDGLTTNQYKVCKTCGYLRCVTEHIREWINTAESHYMTCRYCRFIIGSGKHTFVDNKCIECEYTK